MSIINKNILVISVSIFIFSQFMVVSPQILDCARLMMKVAKAVLKIYSQCSKDFLQQLENNEREYHRRVDRVMKCVMDRVGLLDELGKVTNDTMQVFFDKFIPEDYHEIGHIMVEGCIEDHAPLMTHDEEEDDTCSAYGDFVNCVQGVVSGAC